MLHRLIFAIFTTVLSVMPLRASPVISCHRVVFADTGQTDVTAATALATTVLRAIGYEVEVRSLPVLPTLTGLATADVDVFLGARMPVYQLAAAPFLDSGIIEIVRPHTIGLSHTLYTNKTGASLGIDSFSKISRHADILGWRILGAEPGNIANHALARIISQDEFGLGPFAIIESSEAGLIAEIMRADQAGNPVVFMGWTPHPQIDELKGSELTGGTGPFAADTKGVEMVTITRQNLSADCPNLGTFFRNLQFSAEMTSSVMSRILLLNTPPAKAAYQELHSSPQSASPWLEGVTTYDGNDPYSALDHRLSQGE